MSEADLAKVFAGDDIDRTTFEQILEMDDDDEHDFSKGIVYDFFQQAEETFDSMEKYLEEKNLDQLSALGHFLKGSSATLGLTKVKNNCEKIQHFGARKDATGTKDVKDDEQSLRSISKAVDEAKEDFEDAKRKLQRFFEG